MWTAIAFLANTMKLTTETSMAGLKSVKLVDLGHKLYYSLEKLSHTWYISIQFNGPDFHLSVYPICPITIIKSVFSFIISFSSNNTTDI